MVEGHKEVGIMDPYAQVLTIFDHQYIFLPPT